MRDGIDELDEETPDEFVVAVEDPRLNRREQIATLAKVENDKAPRKLFEYTVDADNVRVVLYTGVDGDFGDLADMLRRAERWDSYTLDGIFTMGRNFDSVEDSSIATGAEDRSKMKTAGVNGSAEECCLHEMMCE